MNLANIATVLNDDVPLSAISLCGKILDKIEESFPDISNRFNKDQTGSEIMETIDSLDGDKITALLELSLVNFIETQTVIHDATLYRRTDKFSMKKREIWPKRILATFLSFGLITILFEVAHYVFILKANGEQLHGAIYSFLLLLFKVLKPIFL